MSYCRREKLELSIFGQVYPIQDKNSDSDKKATFFTKFRLAILARKHFENHFPAKDANDSKKKRSQFSI